MTDRREVDAQNSASNAPRSTAARVRLRDVAEAAAVSVSVVSRVLNDDPTLRVRKDKRQRVKEVAEQLGYRPNFAGRSLRTHSTGAIGVMLPQLTQPFFEELIQGVEDECDKSDLTPILGRSERLVGGSSLLARMVGEGRVDGFIVHLTEDFTQANIDELLHPDVPRVLIEHHAMGQPGSVTLDGEGGIRVAVEHLAGLGHRTIALATGKRDLDAAQVREAAFRDAMAVAGRSVSERWIQRTGMDFEAGIEAFAALWAGDERPTAIVAADVNLGLGILRAAYSADVNVPHDLSVIAVHDSRSAIHSVPALSTVRLPLYRLGRVAVRHLSDILRGESREVIGITDPAPQLVLRESTSALG